MTTPYQRIKIASILCNDRRMSKTQAYDIIEDCDFDNLVDSAKLLKIDADTLKKLLEEE